MKTSPCSQGAFTLIELMVVITIIAILTGLGMAAFSKARRSSDRAAALAKMRQLAVATQTYINENEGYLPARIGMQTGQSPRFNADTGSGGLTSTLAYQLYKYLGLSKPTNAFQYAAPLSHPAYERHLMTNRQWDSSGNWNSTISPVFILNKKVTDPNGTIVYPWGDSTSNISSMTMVAVTEMGGASKLWAMQDVDQKNIKAINGSSLPGWYSLLPKTALLDTVRHVLFFDWHVEAVPSDYVQLQSGTTKL